MFSYCSQLSIIMLSGQLHCILNIRGQIDKKNEDFLLRIINTICFKCDSTEEEFFHVITPID